jgi:hydrogenase maturation protein HypF
LTSPLSGPAVLGVGAELKNTFCHTRENNAFISQHLGDLKNFPTLTSFERSIKHFEDLFRIQPALLVHDLHPDYLSTRYAIDRSDSEAIPTLGVQHHHAHIASCLADNLDSGEEPVIGMAFDGIGYGDDGKIWGGEVLLADYHTYQRISHLEYFPLPGGDLAIREPWRTALALLDHLGIEWDPSLPAVAYAQSLREALPGAKPIDVLQKQLRSQTFTHQTSSLGRLFDAASALFGLRQVISYEGQAAIELEAIADPAETGSYPLEISPANTIMLSDLIREMIKDFQQGAQLPTLSAKFHNTLSAMVLELARIAEKSHSVNRVALSGGVWQNMSLLSKSIAALTSAGFQVLIHHQIPPNDGGVSLGQAVIGLKTLSVED